MNKYLLMFVVVACGALMLPAAFAQEIDPALKAAIDSEAAGQSAENSKPGFFSEIGSGIADGFRMVLQPEVVTGALVGQAIGRDTRSTGYGAAAGLLLSQAGKHRGQTNARTIGMCNAENREHRLAAVEFARMGERNLASQEMRLVRRCDDHGRRSNRGVFYTSSGY